MSKLLGAAVAAVIALGTVFCGPAGATYEPEWPPGYCVTVTPPWPESEPQPSVEACT